jgi:hypothetical protein
MMEHAIADFIRKYTEILYLSHLIKSKIEIRVMKSWSMLLALGFMGLSNLAFSQCECGEDLEGPQFDAPGYKLIEDCGIENPYDLLSPQDNCTIYPGTNAFYDTLSYSYCGLKPLSSSSCGFTFPWNLYLAQLPLELRYFRATNLGFRELPNNEGLIYGELESVDNPNATLLVNIKLYDGLNWEAYSSQGNYEANCNELITEYQDWTYFKLNGSSSSLVGEGDLIGTNLNLSHIPMDFTLAFQVGESANGHTSGYGIGGTFNCSGTLVSESLLLNASIETTASLAAELSCCEKPYFKVNYSAIDDCGNSGYFTQIVEILDLTAPILTNPFNSQIPVTCEGLAAWEPIYEDNCSQVVYSVAQTDTELWYIGSDACGNSIVTPINAVLTHPLGDQCNLSGCTDSAAAEYDPYAIVDDGSCFNAAIDVYVFLDEDENGIFNSNERGISQALVNSTADFGVSTTDADGHFTAHYYTNSLYNIIEVTFGLTGFTAFSSDNLQVVDGSNPPDAIYVGFAPQQIQPVDVIINLVPETQPCDQSEWSLIVDVYNQQIGTINNVPITIVLPAYCSLISADNLDSQVGQEIIILTSAIEQGESGRYKLNLGVNLDLISEGEDIAIVTSSSDDNSQSTHLFSTVCEQQGQVKLFSAPEAFSSENYLLAQNIEYYFIYKETSSEFVNSFDVALFPNDSLDEFDPSTIASNRPFTYTYSTSPERYDIHFRDLALGFGDVISLTYELDASRISNNLEIIQSIQYLADETFGISNELEINIINCDSYRIQYASNLDQCISDIQIEAFGQFYTTYDWFVDDNLIESFAQSINIPIDTSITSIRMEASNLICRDSLLIEVGEIYTPRFIEFPELPSSFCENESVLIIPTSNATDIQWYVDNELMSVGSQFVIDQTATILAEAPAFGPCGAAFAEWSITETVLPEVSLSYDGDSLLCPQEVITVTAASLLDTFNVYFNDLEIFGEIIDVDQAGLITITSSNECGIDQAIQAFTPSPDPSVSFEINGEVEFCEGSFVNLDVSSVGTLEVLQDNTAVVNFPFNVYESSVITATATNLCGSATEQLSIQVNPNPVAEFIFDETTQTLMAVGSGSYQWYLNGEPIVNATNESYTIQETGAYSLVIVSEFGCTDMSSTEFLNHISIKELLASELTVFPNPTKTKFVIKAMGKQSIEFVLVYDSKGTIMTEIRTSSPSFEIDAAQWPTGIYHLVTPIGNLRLVKV